MVQLSSSRLNLCLLLVLLLICPLVVSDCIKSYYPIKTTIGKVHSIFDNLQINSQRQSQIYQYSLIQNINDMTNTHTVIGVNGFQLQKKNSQFGYQIDINFNNNKPSVIIFTISTIKGQNTYKNIWYYLDFNFIVSQSQDIYVGSNNIKELIPTNDPNNFKVSQQILTKTIVNVNNKNIIKIFLSGVNFIQKNKLSSQSIAKIDQTLIKIQNLKNNYSWNTQLIKKFTSIISNQKYPTLKLSQPTFTNNNILNFEIQTSQIDLKALSYSYLIYLNTDNNINKYLIIYGNFIAYDQSKYYYTKLKNTQIMILGINSLRYSNQDSTNINSNINNLKLQIKESHQNNKQVYQTKTNSINNEYQFQYFSLQIKPQKICDNCVDSPILYQQFCISQCLPGYSTIINSQGIQQCQECSIQNFMIPSEDKKTCKCAQGRYLVSPKQICQVCPYDCLTCNGNICLTCDSIPNISYRVLNIRNNRCQCPSVGYYDNKILQIRQCIACNFRCLTCSGPAINQCLSCSASSNRKLVSNLCVCNTNFIQISTTATTTANNNVCKCQLPYILTSSGQCMLPNNKNCLDQFQQPNTLSAIPSCNCIVGYFRSILTNRCIKQCQSYQQYSYNTLKCQCKQGYVRDINNICYKCQSKLNMIYNNINKKCQCLDGFQLNIKGQCIKCPSKSYYNTQTNQCQCVFNYYQDNYGNCTKCVNNFNNNCKIFGGGLQL